MHSKYGWVDVWMEKSKVNDGWVVKWVDGWMCVKAILRIAHRNQKLKILSIR